jgi:hypothetical protein
MLSLFGSRRARAQRRAAIAIDLEAGVLEQCPVCRGIADKLRDDRLPLADALAAARIAEGDPEVAAFAGDLVALQAKLRDVRREFRYSCTCEWVG